jgi:D-glycero-D-manno-heptose 1,7-bisphosphate phosphatase
MAEPRQPAVFLDRDGTLVHDPGFLHRPEDVRLLPGAGPAVARLNAAGFLAVAVSNQSGIGRGLYDEAAYHAVQRRLVELLAAHGARLDGAFFCPHYPPVTGPCDCRKPGTRLFEDAQAALAIDLARSWWVGDRVSDVAPARALGGRGILVLTGEGARQRCQAEAAGADVAPDLAGAVAAIVRGR